MSLRGWVLDRLPMPVSLDEYEDTAEAIAAHLRSLPGLVAIYRTGSVSALGISDLDRIAVVEGHGPFPSVWPFLSPRQRYIAMHTPFLVDRETFSLQRWFALFEPLSLIEGEDVPFEDPPDEKALDRLAGVEGLVLTRLRLEKQRFTGRVKVRPMLCELNNLRHDLRRASLGETAAPDAWAVTRETTALRTTWWELTPAERAGRVSLLAATAEWGVNIALAASVSHGDDESPVPDFRLQDPWSNVTLVSGTHASRSGLGRALPSALSRNSRRASELRWRAVAHRLPVPPGARALLRSALLGDGPLLEGRRRKIRQYRSFIANHAQGWSSIGIAQTFVGE